MTKKTNVRQSKVMDFASSIFSFDQISELLESSPAPIQQQTTTKNNLVEVKKPSKPIQKRNFPNTFDNIDDDNERHSKKKMIHREVERVRRQEMATLQRTLRSLLPIDCLKGKRSMADHLDDTVGYIKKLQKRIENLSGKREKLKQLMNPTSFNGVRQCSPSCSKTNVMVKASREGMEVAVSTAIIEGLKLSMVLNILAEEGLLITSCTSTKVDGRLLHTIESEVGEGRSIDTVELQQKLISALKIC